MTFTVQSTAKDPVRATLDNVLTTVIYTAGRKLNELLKATDVTHSTSITNQNLHTGSLATMFLPLVF